MREAEPTTVLYALVGTPTDELYAP